MLHGAGPVAPGGRWGSWGDLLGGVHPEFTRTVQVLVVSRSGRGMLYRYVRKLQSTSFQVWKVVHDSFVKVVKHCQSQDKRHPSTCAVLNIISKQGDKEKRDKVLENQSTKPKENPGITWMCELNLFFLSLN